ncbi:UNVERIFIED_CONTAM: putative MATE family efflux protein [Acetivibrio alkalicellulosi]
MTIDNISKRISLFALTWPILVETFLRLLFGSVDTFMLSGYSDKAVAAVGAANQYVFFVIILFQVVASGSGIVVSQYLGAKKYKNALDVVLVSVFLNLLLGILISGVLFLFTGSILGLMSFEQDVMNYAVDFLTIVGSFCFIQALTSTITANLRSYGYMKHPMFINMGANLLNVIGNYILITGRFGLPALGVRGVAISTVGSQLVALILIFIVMIKNLNVNFSIKHILSIGKEKLLAILMEIYKIGGPSAGEMLSYNTSQIVITGIITKYMGTLALASRFYVFNLMLYIMLFSLAIGQATQILVGHMVGAGKIEEAYKTCIRSLKICIIISFSIAIVFALFSENLLSLFTNDKEILSMGRILFFIAIFLEPGRAFNIVLGNSLKGTGDAKFTLYLGVISMWGIAVLVTLILGAYFGLGLIGVWIAFASDEWVRGIIMLKRWRSKAWQSKAIVKSKDDEKTPSLAMH